MVPHIFTFRFATAHDFLIEMAIRDITFAVHIGQGFGI